MAKKKKRSEKKQDVEKDASEDQPTEVPMANEPKPASGLTFPTAALTPVPNGESGPGNLAKSFSFLLLLAIIGLIGLLSYRVLSSFVLPLFLAALVVVIFGPVHTWIKHLCREHKSLAAGLTTAAILVVALGPVTWMVVTGVREGMELTDRSWDSDLEKLSKTREYFGLEMPFPDELADIQAQLNSLALKEDRTKAAEDVQEKRELVGTIAKQIGGFKEQLLADVLERDTKQFLPVDLSSIPVVDGESMPLSKLNWVLLKEAERLKLEAQQKKQAGDAPALEDSELSKERREFFAKLEQTKSVIANLDRIDMDKSATETDLSVTAPLTQLKNIVSEENASALDIEDIDQYEESVDLIGGQYALARQNLLGGVPWAPIIEFVNPSKDRIDQLRSMSAAKLRSWMVKLTGQTTSLMSGLLMQLFIFTIATYYFLVDGPQMISSAMQLSPMDDKHEAEIIDEFAKLSRAVVVATLLSAIVQGLLAGVGYFAVWGFDSLFVLIMLTTILAMIPFVGAAAVWVPACIYLAFIGDPVRIPAAIGLAIYGTCVVSMADNVIKPWVLKGQSNLHPLFALLSVLGGVGALGPIGVLVGPMVVAFLQSLLKILHKEMHGVDSVPSA